MVSHASRRLCGLFILFFLTVQGFALAHRYHHDAVKDLLTHDSSLCQVIDHVSADHTAASATPASPITVVPFVRVSLTQVPNPKTDPRLAFLARGPPST